MGATLVGPGGTIEVANDVGNPLPVTFSGGIAVSGEVEVKNDSGSPVPVSAASLPLPSGAATQATLVLLLAALADILTELGQKMEPGGTVALDAASLAALETISVANFPAVQPVSDNGGALTIDGTVAIDAASLAALETIQVGNFPATQAVSGTVTANLGTIDGAATEVTLDDLRDRVPDESGTWGYAAGTVGTEVVPGGARVLQITAIALTVAGTVAINDGDAVPVPVVSGTGAALTICPRGNLQAPTIVFTGTDAFFIEWVS